MADGILGGYLARRFPAVAGTVALTRWPDYTFAMDCVVFAACPYHDPEPSESAKSFEINGLTGRFHCHACGMEGDVRPLAHAGRYVALVPDSQPETSPESHDAVVEALGYVRQWTAGPAEG